MNKNSLQILMMIIFMPCLVSFKFTREICDKYGLGRNWYCEKQASTQEEQLLSATDILKMPVSGETRAKLLNALWDTQRKRAIITRKKHDYINFLKTQYKIAELGFNFAKDIQRITETTPKFQINSSEYKSITKELLESEEREKILKNANRRYGLVFVYSTACGYCRYQLPVLLRLKEKWNFKILGITLNGDTYPGLDEQIIDPNITQDTNIVSIPTMMLLDLKKGKKIFLARGLNERSQIEDLIVNRIRENENEKAA